MPLEFSGAAPPNAEGIDCGSPSSTHFGSANMTIACWFRNTVGGASMFSNGGNNAGGIRYQLAQNDSGVVRWTMDDNSSKPEAISTATFDDGLWHHAVGVRDGTTMRLYVDGVEADTQAIAAGFSVTPNEALVIGFVRNAADGAPTSEFDGDVDDCRIYGGALSADRVLNLYTARGRDGDVNDLRARFQLGEGTVGSVPASGDVKESGPTGIVTTTVGTPIYTVGELNYKRRFLRA